MGRFSLCLCGRREPGLRVRTDPAHAMLEEQLRASASPRRSAMCPTGPAEGSGPRGLSTHRVESLSEAAQGASGPLGPADLRVPFQAAGPDSRRVWCCARCRAAPGAGSRGPRPPPGAQRPGQATASARGSCPPAPPTSLAAGEESRVEASCAVLPGAGAPSGPLAADSGAGGRAWLHGTGAHGVQHGPSEGRGQRGAHRQSGAVWRGPPREQPGPSLSSGPEPRKQGSGQWPRGRGPRPQRGPPHCPPEHGQGTDLRGVFAGGACGHNPPCPARHRGDSRAICSESASGSGLASLGLRGPRRGRGVQSCRTCAGRAASNPALDGLRHRGRAEGPAAGGGH